MANDVDRAPDFRPDGEAQVVDWLWEASAARAEAVSAASSAAAKDRALNERMHRSALEALDEAHRTQISEYEAAFRAELERIESEVSEANRKLEGEEHELRTKAARAADEHEEQLERALQHKLWLAESVYDAAMPELRKGRAAAIAEIERQATAVSDLAERGFQIVKSYGQRLPTVPPLPDGTPVQPLPSVVDELDRSVTALASCRVARMLSVSVLAGPSVLLVGATAGLGWWILHAREDRAVIGIPPGIVGAVGGALVGVAALAAGIAALRMAARREVRDLVVHVGQVLAHADGAIEAAKERVEQDFRAKEERARRTRDADVAAAEAKYRPRLAKVSGKLDEAISSVEKKVPHYQAKLMRQRAENVAAAEAKRDHAKRVCDRRRERALADEQDRVRSVAAEIDRREADALGAAEAAWAEARSRIVSAAGALVEGDREATVPWGDPAWSRWNAPAAMPRWIRVGRIPVRPSDVPGFSPGGPGAGWPADAAQGWSLPVTMRPDGRASLVVSAPPDRRDEGLRILQNAVARIMTSVPPGKARFTFFDPVGLGQGFAGFMHLADDNPLLVSDRIWTDSRHIESRLADLTEHMETVIQKYLRNEYATLEDYNRQAGEIAEPFRFLVMADFPVNVSESAAKRFASILQSGARCGVHVLLLRDPRAAMPPGIEDQQFRKVARMVSWIPGEDGAAGRWSVDSGRIAELPLEPDAPPDDATLLRLTREVGRAAKDASRVEVPFSAVLPRTEDRWKASTAARLRVPIGRSGANRLQHLSLGEGTSQHVLVAGKTGSGKSSLLNAMIVSAALWHPPSELELWLIDFKKGVEFKAYASSGMPHARVVAVESDREFGMSVLQGLDEELRRRGEMFRSAGVQSISDWRALGRPEPMPRVLLVIDEFQELFIEDDKVAQDSAMLLDRLVRQGRAFGMHAVLGSQTLGGAYGIARSTMGQMGVRIALQCAEADSQLILSDDNSAARLLSRPGEAIYNDAGGRLEGNNPFQVVWLPDEERVRRLQEIAAGPPAPPGRPAAIVFEGNLPADPLSNPQLAEAIAAPPQGAGTVRLWLGDAVSIKAPTAVALSRRSGANFAVIGQSDEQGEALLAMSMASIAAQFRPGTATVSLLLGVAGPDGSDGPLAAFAAGLPLPPEVHGPRQADAALAALGEELAVRSAPGAEPRPPHFIVIDGLHRFRSLRRNDNDFSFDDSVAKTPDKVLGLLLKEGPAVGMHVILWVDTVPNLQRAVDRATVREFNWKALFQMSANDSSTIIDSPVAGRLGAHRAILADDDAGTAEKFRPYPMPGPALLGRFASARGSRA